MDVQYGKDVPNAEARRVWEILMRAWNGEIAQKSAIGNALDGLAPYVETDEEKQSILEMFDRL